MSRKPLRIVLIGAGSVVFTRRLLSDLLSWPALREATLVLHDIDPGRLETAARLARRLADSVDAKPVIEATTERRAALEGADYVVNTIEVGGVEATRLDFDIPARYGLRYAINDTIGVGGVFRGLRTIGPVLDIAADMDELCPDAWLLNHTNPMAMVVRTIAARSRVRTIGLCHSVASTLEAAGRYLGLPADEIEYSSGGVNHLAFLLRIEHRGRDIYPDLRAFARGADLPADDLVRLELLRRLGYYPTESSEHHADYNPWFIPKGQVERFNVPLGEYLERVDDGLAEYQETVRELESGTPVTVERSGEYTAPIVNALETGQPAAIVANIMNSDGLIADLPADACVEVPAVVDRDGLHPETIGAMPPQCTAYIRPAVDTQALAVRAALNEDRDAIYHAVMQDPIVAATLDLEQVWQMTDELIEVESRWLPDWLAATPSA